MIQKESIAVITARGGSKRIPRKNIKPFLGSPIIRYSIEAALEAGCFDEVMVSTDDQEIAEVSIRYGAKVPFFRSNETSTDHADTVSVLKEVILEYENRGVTFNYVCGIYPTAPFITGAKLKAAMGRLKSTGAGSVLPITRFEYPIQRAIKIENGKVKMFQPEHYFSRSQDLLPSFHDCGQFYCLNVQSMLRESKYIMEITEPFEISEIEVQDIDTQIDWELAEFKYKYLKEKGIL